MLPALRYLLGSPAQARILSLSYAVSFCLFVSGRAERLRLVFWHLLAGIPRRLVSRATRIQLQVSYHGQSMIKKCQNCQISSNKLLFQNRCPEAFGKNGCGMFGDWAVEHLFI